MKQESVTKEIINYDKKNINKWKGLSGSTLKIIAVISMLIDHCSLVFLGPIVVKTGIVPVSFENCIKSGNIYAILYITGRIIGRLAFPIYCFLLIEGFKYSRSRIKYGLRLLIFAFISEIPFDLAFYKKPFIFSSQNVFFTLFLGLAAIMLIEWIDEKIHNFIRYIYIFFSIASIAIISLVFNTDYALDGILTIVIMYLFMKKSCDKKLVMGSGALVLTAFNSLELISFINIIPIAFYNGKRGLNIKYFFYLFYPLHLIIIYVIYRICYI